MILGKFFFRKFYREKFWIFFAMCDSLIVSISTFRQNKSTTFWTLKIFPSSAFITFKTKERERERERERKKNCKEKKCLYCEEIDGRRLTKCLFLRGTTQKELSIESK